MRKHRYIEMVSALEIRHLVAHYLLKLPWPLAYASPLATVKMALTHWQSHDLVEHWCLSLACLCCEWSTNYGRVLCSEISEMWNNNSVWYWVVKITLTLQNFDSLIPWIRFSYTEEEKCFCNNKSKFNVFEMSARGNAVSCCCVFLC